MKIQPARGAKVRDIQMRGAAVYVALCDEARVVGEALADEMHRGRSEPAVPGVNELHRALLEILEPKFAPQGFPFEMYRARSVVAGIGAAAFWHRHAAIMDAAARRHARGFAAFFGANGP